jgi:hypothetical protein
MLRFTSQSSHQFFTRLFLQFSLPVLLLLISIPSFGAELSIEYEVIARSGATPVPGGTGTFTGLVGVPAIDDEGTVAFVGAGVGQAGVYTYIGAGLQMVADYDTLIPGGGGATFAGFLGAESLDIDGGRVAFMAINQFNDQGLYSNIGQASPADLVEIAVIDGVEWATGGRPWVDGDVVAMTGERLIPSLHDTILRWDGPSQGKNFIDLGAGFNLAGNAQASISGAEAIFARIDPNVYEIGISSGGGYETLAVADVTPMPGQGGVLFIAFSPHPVIDRGGLDVAFMGYGDDGTRAVVKRADGGTLQNVADKNTEMPGSGGLEFGSFIDSGIALANGQVMFMGNQFFFEGIYTDIGGELSVIVDNEDNGLIELDGQLEEVIGLNLGSRSFVLTPQGYMVAFKANLASGESAIIRATITVDDSGPGTPGTSTASRPTADFEDGNADGWLLNGNVAIDGILAIGDFSLRHGKNATSVLNVSTAGYEGVSVTMHLAATSLKKRDTCYAEVSSNGGNSWLPVIELQDPNDDGTFYSGTVSPPGADDNLNLQLRFRASGKGKKGYCYGDDVTVLGTLIGGVQSAP